MEPQTHWSWVRISAWMVLRMECRLLAPAPHPRPTTAPPLPPAPPLESWFPEILFLLDSLKDLSAGSLLFLNSEHLAQEKRLHLRKWKMFLLGILALSPLINISLLALSWKKAQAKCARSLLTHLCCGGRRLSTWTQLCIADLPVLTHLLPTFLFVPALPLVS